MDQKYNLTQEGLEKLKKKYEELKIRQAENIIAIQEARGQGDLSENADYDAAKDAQRDIAAELKDIENKINNAVIITSTEHNNLGKFITVRFLDENEEETYHLVGTIEADPLVNKISDLSPLGKAIINAKQGSTVRVKTEDGEQFDVLIVKISKK